MVTWICKQVIQFVHGSCGLHVENWFSFPPGLEVIKLFLMLNTAEHEL